MKITKYILIIITLTLSLVTTQKSFAQNGWVVYPISSPGGTVFHFGNANTGIIMESYSSNPKYNRTTDGGLTWTTLQKPDTNFNLKYTDIFFINSQTGWLSYVYGFFGLAGGTTFKTTDGGLNWGTAINSGAVQDIQFLTENTGYIATGSVPTWITEGSIKKSTDGGASWQGLYGGYYFVDVSFIDLNTGWAIGYYGDDIGTHISLMIRTTDGGIGWNTLIMDSSSYIDRLQHIQFLDENTGYLLKNKLYKSTNAGDNWIPLDTNVFTGSYLRKFHFINKDTGWITGINNGKIFRTNNGGMNWTEQNTPVTSMHGEIYFIDGFTGWAAAGNNTILKTGTGGITSVTSLSSEIPSTHKLYQNYPNPFNPVTNIKFDVSSGGKLVKLVIYNSLGQETANLINKELQAGTYEYSFNGSGLASGIYYYKLILEGEATDLRKMVLLK